MTLLPNYEQAFIAIEKLSQYCLNPFHPVGKDKAMVFKSLLNFTEQDAGFLKDAILEGLARNEALSGIQDQYGKRFTIDIKIRNLDKEAMIRTAWIIKKGENFPRLITCYIK
jgi:hypothetical protein